MTSPMVTRKAAGSKGFYSEFAFVPAKSGSELFAEGANLDSCETDRQADEWLIAEAAMIDAYLAEEAAKVAKREAFIAQVRAANRAIQLAAWEAKKAAEMKGALAYLKVCQLEGMPAANALSVFA
jgi:hypothetical protein